MLGPASSGTCASAKHYVAAVQAADFLFGSAQPHDVQFEQLFRIFAAGNLGAAAASLAIKVCAWLAAACTYLFSASIYICLLNGDKVCAKSL